ncbi:MAG: twin-arginine translocation signal domain-containing protein [Candidatus Zixiibacteriota bacterium]|nr:MAG: twin-arginine translocation signal domain-containing protein [candidate division Zixibacteria bacterium]
MKRRDFLELSAVASAAIMLGSLSELKNPHSVNGERNALNSDRGPRMCGGCKDFRVMNDCVPGFFEREIFDGWA